MGRRAARDRRVRGLHRAAAADRAAALLALRGNRLALAQPYWGKGLATEGARAALRFGFETLGLDEIVSFTVPANKRSRAVMERLGMQEDKAGSFEHPSIAPGSPLRLHCLYRLSKKRWSELL